MSWNKDDIIALMLEVGEISLRLRRDIRHETKADHSLVTAADREIEGVITRALENPEDGTFIIGEETVAQKGEDYLAEAMRKETFVVDPIDGTVPYAHGLPNWGISIGRMDRGRLVDGAVYLPMFGEMVLSDGDAVLEGSREGENWTWREIGESTPDDDGRRLTAVTQEVAKRGRVELPNPVMVLGAAVVPLVGLLQGRFAAYLGSVRLWDVAGGLPLLLRKGYSITVCPDGERREVSATVDDQVYVLDPNSRQRWKFRTDLLVCHPSDEERFRAAFVYG
jgi:fructose-1,6-bisphosphatase/inositol monophosphatase family enzyme